MERRREAGVLQGLKIKLYRPRRRHLDAGWLLLGIAVWGLLTGSLLMR